MSDNTEEYPDLTPEEIQAALDNFAKMEAEELDATNAHVEKSKNAEIALAEKKKQDEEKKMQSEFKKFVEDMPRKTKRNIFPQKKFGNVLMETFRKQRVTSQKHK